MIGLRWRLMLRFCNIEEREREARAFSWQFRVVVSPYESARIHTYCFGTR